MREAAADRAAVADRGMRDMGDRFASATARARRCRRIARDRHGASARRCASTSPVTAMPRSSAISPISTMSSGEIRRRFIAGIRLWPPESTFARRHARRATPARSHAGCAGVAESRGLHRCDLPGRNLGVFFGIRRRRPLKVKFVYRTIISDDSTFGLVIMSQTRAVRCAAKSAPGRSADHESGFLYHADPSARQGLAAIAARRSRSLPAGRRTRVHRGLCRRTRHRQGREHHLLRRVPRLDRRRHQADQARHRHHQHAEHPSGRHRRPAWRCSITCSTDG